MFSDLKKQHIILFLLMLALLFGGGVQYGKYLEAKSLPPVLVSPAGTEAGGEEEFSADGSAKGDSPADEGKAQKNAPELMVHVTGAVSSPGVYKLPEGSRVMDAVDMAGLGKDADLNGINLARKIKDQEMIFVPYVNEEGAMQGEAPAQRAAAAGASILGSTGSMAGGQTLININLADAAQLETLPGIGPSKAAAIIRYREENGVFRVIEDLQNVSGIGPATFEKLKDFITI